MQLTLLLNQMSMNDKFLLLEQLWENLTQNAVNMGFSPKWHFDILRDRELQIKRECERIAFLEVVL